MGTNSAAEQKTPKSAQAAPVSSQSLANALFTGTQQRLFGLLFGQPKRTFFVTELIQLAGVGRGAVQRELSRLARSGLVLSERHGNQKHYRANPDAPVYKELCSIIRKTVGIRETIRAALEPLESRMSLALIYGSVAKRSDTANSDIDLLVVSDDLILEDLYLHLAPFEKQLGRQINPTLYTGMEFNKRRTGGNTFLMRVLGGPHYLLKGDLDVA